MESTIFKLQKHEKVLKNNNSELNLTIERLKTSIYHLENDLHAEENEKLN